MKVAYYSAPSFLDCDIPLISHLQKRVDVDFFLDLNPSSLKQSMLANCEIKEEGIQLASNIPGFERLGKYLNLNKVYVVWRSKSNRFSLFASSLKLLCFFRKKKYNIIHLTCPLNYTSFLLYYLHSKMILTVHDPLPHSSNINRSSLFHRWVALKLIEKFIILNKTQKEDFISTYHLEDKLVFESRLGVYYHLKAVNPVIPSESGYALFFGYISRYKGADVLCEAMRIVKKQMSDAKVIIAGRGGDYFDIQQYVKDGTIELRNYYISDEELAGLIINASFVVCPYIDATQSGVVMSAYSLNKPVVVSDVGGLPEMVEYGKYGPVVHAGNVEELAETMITLYQSSNQLDLYSSRIKKDFYEGEKSWSKIVDGVVSIYSNCK